MRGAHARARRQAVIHQDQDLAGDVRWGTVLPVGALASLQLPAFFAGDLLDDLRWDLHAAHDVLVEHDDPATGDCAHRQLFMAGDAELANDEHIERSAQGGGDLVRDGHAATRQRQHDDVVATLVMLQAGSASSRPASRRSRNRRSAGCVVLLVSDVLLSFFGAEERVVQALGRWVDCGTPGAVCWRGSFVEVAQSLIFLLAVRERACRMASCGLWGPIGVDRCKHANADAGGWVHLVVEVAQTPFDHRLLGVVGSARPAVGRASTDATSSGTTRWITASGTRKGRRACVTVRGNPSRT